jgi:hypothetical protein
LLRLMILAGSCKHEAENNNIINNKNLL